MCEPKPGQLAWIELLSSDVDETQRFVETVFGWTVKQQPFYKMCFLGDDPIAGISSNDVQWGQSHKSSTDKVDVKNGNSQTKEGENGTPKENNGNGKVEQENVPTNGDNENSQNKAENGDSHETKKDEEKPKDEEKTSEKQESKPQEQGENDKEHEVKPVHRPQCLIHFMTRDIKSLVEKVPSLSGEVIAHPFDVMNFGIMAVCKDPAGSIFALWEPKEHKGMKFYNDMQKEGAPVYFENNTNKFDDCTKFYSELFGYDVEKLEMNGANYNQFKLDDLKTCGLLEMDKSWGETPPHWMVYFAVKDIDQITEKIKEAKGKVCIEPFETPNVGKIAVVEDPCGIVFTIAQYTNKTANTKRERENDEEEREDVKRQKTEEEKKE